MVEQQEGTKEIEAADLGFGKQHRLRTAGGFSLVFADRRRLRGNVFDLHFRSQVSGVSGPIGARLGIVIAKKLSHRAVQRNLLKRLARETFRVVRHKLPPYDLILRLAKPPGNSLDTTARSTWRADIEQLFIRLPR